MSNVQDLITFKQMNKMLNDYKNNPIKSNSVFIEIDKLRDYLDFVEAESKIKNIDVSGIRMHLVADTDNQTTVVLSPTYEDTNDKSNMPHISFDPKFSQNGQPAILSVLLKNKADENAESVVQNGGHPCPMYCPPK